MNALDLILTGFLLICFVCLMAPELFRRGFRRDR